ncbi:MAG TPA: hypothetical protein VK457_24190 [Chloroflexota bacterium]|nr:hypothetical protein [Chloroflexota bacterium]
MAVTATEFDQTPPEQASAPPPAPSRVREQRYLRPISRMAVRRAVSALEALDEMKFILNNRRDEEGRLELAITYLEDLEARVPGATLALEKWANHKRGTRQWEFTAPAVLLAIFGLFVGEIGRMLDMGLLMGAVLFFVALVAVFYRVFVDIDIKALSLLAEACTLVDI